MVDGAHAPGCFEWLQVVHSQSRVSILVMPAVSLEVMTSDVDEFRVPAKEFFEFSFAVHGSLYLSLSAVTRPHTTHSAKISESTMNRRSSLSDVGGGGAEGGIGGAEGVM